MKSFIIHLSKIETSLESALKLKGQLENYNIPVHLFEGSYGNIVKKEYEIIGRQCHPWGIKGPAVLFSEDTKKELSSPGIIGCFDSHYRLWKLCVEIDEPILVFEDDACIIRNFIPVEWEEVLSVASSHTKKMGRYLHYLENPQGEPKAADYLQSSMPGNAGYAIKPNAAKKLVETYTNTFLPADNAINQHIVKIQIHSHMMGRAKTKHEGNVSLIRTKFWNE